MEEMARVADFAERLRRYFFTLSAAYAFFTFGMAIAGYWLLAVSIKPIAFPNVGWEQYSLAAAAVMGAIAGLCVMVLEKTAPKASLSKDWREGFKWLASFAVPFFALYLIPVPEPSLYALMWYPALALAHLAVYLLLERPRVRRGLVVARPFLLSSVEILATTPIVFYAHLMCGIDCSWAMALGLMLLSYCAAGIYAMHRASKLFA